MPKTCLLITTFGRTPLLRRSLDRLLTHTLPDEVLVVDDGGSDGCREECESYRDRLSIRYLYNHNPQPSICSMARNIGIKSTDAEIVITSEPEVMFLTDVIGQMLAVHAEIPGDVVSAGTVYHAYGPNQLQPERCERIVGWVAPFTALYRREWLMEIGGWDESFPGSWGWDDTDLLTRLRCAGHYQVIDLDIEILHQWHTKNQDNQSANEQHFFDKDLFNGGSRDHVVANQGREWGVIKTT